MKPVSRSVGVVLLMVVASLSVKSQETTNPEQTTTPTTTTNQPTTDAYVFPTPKERFKRYLSSTAGPFALLRISAAAGINQWRDSPEEWGQGAKGYGRRLPRA